MLCQKTKSYILWADATPKNTVVTLFSFSCSSHYFLEDLRASRSRSPEDLEHGLWVGILDNKGEAKAGITWLCPWSNHICNREFPPAVMRLNLEAEWRSARMPARCHPGTPRLASCCCQHIKISRPETTYQFTCFTRMPWFPLSFLDLPTRCK